MELRAYDPSTDGDVAPPDIGAIIDRYADERSVPRGLARALFKQESGFNPRAVNDETGATGLGQLMPATAQELGVTDRTDPEQNIRASLDYLRQGYDREGTTRGALHFFYGGPDKSQWGPNTRAYPDQVIRHAQPAERATWQWGPKVALRPYDPEKDGELTPPTPTLRPYDPRVDGELVATPAPVAIADAQPEYGDEFNAMRSTAASEPAERAPLPPGAPGARSFDPSANPEDALALELTARKAAADTAANAPMRPGPTVEAAQQLQRDQVMQQAAETPASNFARAHAIAKAVDAYKDGMDWTEQHPVFASTSSGLAQGISSTGDFLWMQAREAQQRIDNGENPVSPNAYWQNGEMRGLSQIASIAQEGLRRLLPADEKGTPKRLQWAADLDEASNLLKPQLAGLSFTDAQKSDQLLKWLVVQAGEQSPNHAMLLATVLAPGLAPITLPSMAAQSAGNQYAENVNAGVAHDPAYLDATINGALEMGGEALEAVFGYVGAKAIGRTLLALPAAQREAAAATILGKALKAGGAAVGTMVAEGAGEGATQIGQDLSQQKFAGRDPGDIVENAKTAAAIGAFMGGTTTAVAAAAHVVPEIANALDIRRAAQEADDARAATLEKWNKFGDLLAAAKPMSPAESSAAPTSKASPIIEAPAAPLTEDRANRALDRMDAANRQDEKGLRTWERQQSEAAWAQQSVATADTIKQATNEAARLSRETGRQHRARLIAGRWNVIDTTKVPGENQQAVEDATASTAAEDNGISTPETNQAPITTAAQEVARGEALPNARGTEAIAENVASEATNVADKATIDAAAHEAATSPLNDLPEPTAAQKEAGNYQKGHIDFQGLDVSIENPAGSKRRPEWPTLQNHYGYIRQSLGADGDHVDTFIGPHPDSRMAYVVDQLHKDGTFDEHKTMLGFDSPKAAREAYLSNYTPGWQGLGAMTAMPMAQFKAWVADPAITKRPAAPALNKTESLGTESAAITPEELAASGYNDLSPQARAQIDEVMRSIEPSDVQAYLDLHRETLGNTSASTAATTPAPLQELHVGDRELLEPAPAKARTNRAQRRAAEMRATLEAHFTPGNIVKGYGGVDRVLGFNWNNGEWRARVEEVKQRDGKWEAVGPPREHATFPGKRDEVIQRAPNRRIDSEARKNVESSIQTGEAGNQAATEVGQEAPAYEAHTSESKRGTYRSDERPHGRAEASSSDTVRYRPDPGVRGVKWLARGIVDHLRQEGATSLVGRVVTTPQDLADLAQIYRNPRYEVFRVFFTKGDTIVHATGVSARLPGRTPIFPDNLDEGHGVAWLREHMERAGADGYWLLHNHPSGAPTPSRPDLAVTKMLENKLPGFRGHVIINHDAYGLIHAGSGHAEVIARDFKAENLHDPSMPHVLLGQSTVTTPRAVATTGWSLQRPGWITIIGQNNRGISALAEIHTSEWAHPARVRAAIRAFARRSGSDQVFAYGGVDDLKTASRQQMNDLVRDGFLTDIIHGGGEHSLRVDVRPDPEMAFGRVVARQMREEPSVTHVAEPSDAAESYAGRISQIDNSQPKLAERVGALLSSDKSIHWWNGVNTPYHIAYEDNARGRAFRPVYDEVQAYLRTYSRAATDAANLAPTLLPQIQGFRDAVNIFKGLDPFTAKKVLRPVAKAIFEGTLAHESGDPHKGRKWSDDELRHQFGLNAKQVQLYHEYRAAVDHSLDELLASEVGHLARADLDASSIQAMRENPHIAGEIAGDALVAKAQHIEGEISDLLKGRMNVGEEALAKQAEAHRLVDLAQTVYENQQNTHSLQAHGYSPLMRFGKYQVSAEDQSGKLLYFSLHETQREANLASREAREMFPGALISSGIKSQDSYQLYKGLTPDTLELFAQTLGVGQDSVFQSYLRVAKNSRSAMKRLIHRKGTAGFNDEVTRTLANFIVSNARATAGNWHAGEISRAVEAVPRGMGDVKDYANQLRKFVLEPQNDRASRFVRSFLFHQYLGGSIAAGLVNMTQPVLMSYPYLAQFGAKKAATEMLAGAMKAATGVGIAADTAAAMKRGEEEGVVAPHEVHALMAEATENLGNSVIARRVLSAWGGFFAASEAFNRRATFIAAYEMAKAMERADPYAFAIRAVEETQGVYNKGNRPAWGRSAVGATIMTFKQFSIAYVEFLKRLPPAQRAIALAILFMASGLEGLPFAQDIEDMIDTIAQAMGYSFNSKERLRKFVTQHLGEMGARLVLNGVSGLRGMPIDVQGRLGMGNLIPGSSLLKRSADASNEVAEAFGVAGSFAKSLKQGVDEILSGDFTSRKAALSLMPVALQNLYRAIDMWQTGMYRDTKGRKVKDTDALDAVAKGIGFQPRDVALESKKVQEQLQNIDLHKKVEGDIAEKWAQGVFERRIATSDAQLQAAGRKIESARGELRDWNEKNEESHIKVDYDRQVLKRVHEMNKDRNERMIKTAPREIRQSVREGLQ